MNDLTAGAVHERGLVPRSSHYFTPERVPANAFLVRALIRREDAGKIDEGALREHVRSWLAAQGVTLEPGTALEGYLFNYEPSYDQECGQRAAEMAAP